MTKTRRALRTTFALAIAGVVLCCGLAIRPGVATADVFTLVQRAKQMLQGADVTPHPGGTRTITINGVPVTADLFFVDKEPADAIRRIAVDYSDRYLAEMTDGDPFATLDQAIEEASRPFSDGELAMQDVSSMLGIRSELDELVEQGVNGLVTAIEKPFFSVGEDWAMFGRFPAATWTAAESAGPGTWSKHSYRGLGFVVLAIRDSSGDASVLWRLGFPEDFRWSQLVADGASGGDAPGADIEGVNRFPGSRRLGSIGESAAYGTFRTVTFVGDGSVSAHADYFARVLEREGYTAMPYQSERDGAAWLIGNKGSSQVSVFITRSADRQRVVDVLQWRTGA